MDGRFEDYLRTLRATPLEEHTEHTGRSALEALLNRFAADAAARDVMVQHEPRREGDKGAPDFKVKSQGMILGYVQPRLHHCPDGTDRREVSGGVSRWG